MSLYSDSIYPVVSDIQDIHEAQLVALGGPGTWFPGAERVAIAEQVRAARMEAGVQEGATTLAPAIAGAVLPAPVQRVAREVSVSPQTLVREFCLQAIEDGLSDAEYVEVVGIASRVTNLDIVARGIDVPPRSVGVVRSGNPTRRRPEKAMAEGAWIDTVPSGRRGGDDAQELYGKAMMPFIIRALSLVPGESLAHLELERAQYLPLEKFPDFAYQHHDGLTRPQVEVVAGRVSALNECFY